MEQFIFQRNLPSLINSWLERRISLDLPGLNKEVMGIPEGMSESQKYEHRVFYLNRASLYLINVG
jgi:hypothetical protein